MKLSVEDEPEVARIESRVGFWLFEALISLVTLPGGLRSLETERYKF